MRSLWKHTHRGNGQRANSLGRDAPWPQNPHLTRHRGEHTLDTSRTKTKNKRSALFLAIPLVPVHQPCLPVPPPHVCSWKRNKMMINVMLMSLLFFFFYIYTAVDWREQTRPSKGIWRVGGVCVCVDAEGGFWWSCVRQTGGADGATWFTLLLICIHMTTICANRPRRCLY